MKEILEKMVEYANSCVSENKDFSGFRPPTGERCLYVYIKEDSEEELFASWKKFIDAYCFLRKVTRADREIISDKPLRLFWMKKPGIEEDNKWVKSCTDKKYMLISYLLITTLEDKC